VLSVTERHCLLSLTAQVEALAQPRNTGTAPALQGDRVTGRQPVVARQVAESLMVSHLGGGRGQQMSPVTGSRPAGRGQRSGYEKVLRTPSLAAHRTAGVVPADTVHSEAFPHPQKTGSVVPQGVALRTMQPEEACAEQFRSVV
jgi:hypothetical protein